MVFRIAGAALALSSTAIAAQPAHAPTGKWVAEYADDMCLLQRNYGVAPAHLTLAFKPEPMSDNFTTYVFEAGPKKKVGYVTAQVRLGPAAEAIERRTATYYAPRLKLRVTELSLSREELDRLASSQTMSIDIEDRIQEAFQVPGLSNALAVLDDCVADLLATWGFSREQQNAMATKPKPIQPVFKYVSADDYPIAALKNDEQGSNSARYRIDAAGRVSDCRIVESSGSKELDLTLCRVVRRMRYHPAINKGGEPMESLGFVRFRWQLS